MIFIPASFLPTRTESAESPIVDKAIVDCKEMLDDVMAGQVDERLRQTKSVS
jgi:hypothetical protein